MIKLRTAELFETRQITLLALKYYQNITYDSLYREIHSVISSGKGVVYLVICNNNLIAFAQLQHDNAEPPTASLQRV